MITEKYIVIENSTFGSFDIVYWAKTKDEAKLITEGFRQEQKSIYLLKQQFS